MSHNPFTYAGYDFVELKKIEYANACVELIQVPLFYTANWKVIIKVDGEIRWESLEEQNKPPPEEVCEWVAMMITNNYSSLKLANVDLAKLYRSVGGVPHDLLIY